VHFGKSQISWECQGALHRETSPSGSDYKPEMEDVDEQKQRLAESIHHFDERDWERLVMEDSKRRLTKASDRLPAIESMAREDECFSGLKYCAGLTLEPAPTGLFWIPSSAQTIEQNRNHQCEFRTGRYAYNANPNLAAPSWSWASLMVLVHIMKPIKMVEARIKRGVARSHLKRVHFESISSAPH
jgi:hypothetical protein